MTEVKTNERPGTRAQVRYVRVSAYKAREVLDLIRGLHVSDADQVLAFTERDIARIVRKALASAVANAQNNDSHDPDTLKVVACYADEGPTLKRWLPRARGRATGIRKRTCHITVIGGRQRPEQRQPRPRHPEGRRLLRGRGADPQAVAAAGPGSGHAHPQAHLPHHRHRRPHGRRRAHPLAREAPGRPHHRGRAGRPSPQRRR